MLFKNWGQGVFSPLSSPDYRSLLTGTVLWWECFYMEMVVLGWLVFDLTNSSQAVALVSFCRTLPLLLMGLFAGAIVDYFGRRRVVIAAQFTNLCAYLVLVLLLWSGKATPITIAGVVFVLGMAWAIDWPSRRSLALDILGKHKLVDGLLLESFLTGVARIIGPSIAGTLIARYGAVGCYIVMGLLALLALLSLLPLLQAPIVVRTQVLQISPWAALSEGLRYVRSNQTILAVLLATLIMNLWIFPYTSLLPAFAREVLHQGPLQLGLLSTGTGIGAYLGLLMINRLRRRYRIGTLFIIGTSWMCLSLIVFALSHFYPLSWLMLFSAGVGMSCFGTLQSTIILLTTSDEMRSRVMGLLVLAIGGDPLGQLHIGALSQQLGVQATLATQATAAALAIGLIALLLPEVRQAGKHEG